MDPTFQNVFDDARSLLNDVDIAGGEFATNVALQRHGDRAYREMFDAMIQSQTQLIERIIYWVVPAYSELVSPVGHIGLRDFGEPVRVEERNSLTTVTIATTSATSPILVTTATAHGLTTNMEVTVMGVANTTSPWGRWFVTVVDGTSFTLNSSITDTVAGTGGTACWSNENFVDVRPTTRISDHALSDRLGSYFWDEGSLKFRGASTARQIRVTYKASGAPPTLVNQPFGIDNCLNFLGCRTASLLAGAKGWTQRADSLAVDALGPKKTADGSGGFLRGFLNAQVLQLQGIQRQRGPFRRHRGDWGLL